MILSHIAYIKTKNLILTQNSTSDAQELTKDVRKYKIKEIRLMNVTTFRDSAKTDPHHKKITRYVANGKVKWGLVSYEVRGEDYYMNYSRILSQPLGMPMLLRDLDALYKQYNREDILKDLGI